MNAPKPSIDSSLVLEIPELCLAKRYRGLHETLADPVVDVHKLTL